MTLAAEDIIRANVLNATPSHGRFSQWTGTQHIDIPLPTLRAALALDGQNAEQVAAAKRVIAALIKDANPRHLFTSWAGANASSLCVIRVSELQDFVGGAA